MTKGSFYLQRVNRFLDNRQHDQVGVTYQGRWIGNKYFNTYHQLTLTEISKHEVEYKGYQIIVLGWHRECQEIFNLNGETVTRDLPDDQIGRLGDKKVFNTYSAYAWKIGTDFDNEQNLNWLYEGATVTGGTSTSQKTTLTSAKKRIDLIIKLEECRDAINKNASVMIECSRSEALNPYNALVGDEPFIQAHGRLRKGVIVATTGSRFIVGYSTPSNTRDLKYKTLPLSRLWVEP